MCWRGKKMRYELAGKEELLKIHNIVQQTIKTVYPKYYPKEVVEFFCEHHNQDAILKDIEERRVGVLRVNDEIVATGSYENDHITRVYVLPKHQNKGYGTFIIKSIESEISKKYHKAFLDASLPGVHLYEKLGYKTLEHKKYFVKNDVVLVYDIMVKELPHICTDIHYDGKIFIPEINSENGEVNQETRFYYHQNGDLLWGEYVGGDIIKGTLIGTVAKDGRLNFTYQHINKNKEIRTGKCQSVPTVMENGKIRLVEKWQWTNGDYSEGSSVLIEI